MRFQWSAGLLRLLPLFLVAGSSGAAPDGEALVRARMVEARLNEVQGLVARFTQTLESPALPQPQVESGVVYFLRPGRMRWEYSEPEGKLAIADGERTHLYLPQDRQVISAPMPGDGGGSGLAFMLRPDGVRVHWITDGKFERTELAPDNMFEEPDNRRGPDALPLKSNGWNRLQLSLAGDVVDLVNGANFTLILTAIHDQVPVPEPATLPLFAAGLMGLMYCLRRRRKVWTGVGFHAAKAGPRICGSS